MNLFERLKETITPRQVAEQYGLTVGRNGMVCCPFHPDRTPSMKLNEDYYYCFGCGAHGDIIAFTAKLLGLRPMEAARQLASDFGIQSNDALTRSVRRPRPKKNPNLVEELCLTYLTGYLLLLRDWEQEFSPRTGSEPVDPRFHIACHSRNYVEYLLTTMDEFPAETAEWLTKDHIIENLQAKIDPYLREEVKHDRYDPAI